MADLIGENIGPYRVTERLGRGGMADVYKAFHTKLEVYRAVKFIRPEFVTSDDFRVRFQKEAQGVARLRHPNIVQMHDFGEDDNRYYMVMEYIDGETLKDRLKGGNAIPIEESVTLVRHVASALEYAHQRDLIHRDIKPDNIMIDADGRPVLMDFGIAKLLTNETQLTQTGMGIGTPAYMAPEQAKALEVGPPADIYALSIVLFEMLTGQVPFSADTPMAVMLKALSDPMPMPRELNANISESLQGVILKGTAKEPADRYQSIAEFLAALDAATGTVGARPDNAATIKRAAPASAPAPTTKRSKTPLLIGVGVVVVLALALSYFMFGGEEASVAESVSSVSEDPPVATASQESVKPKSVVEGSVGSDEGRVSTPPAATGVVRPATSAGEIVYAFRDEIEAEQTVSQMLMLQEGEAIFVNVHDTDATTDFKLMSLDGRETLFSRYGDYGPYVIKDSGQYEFNFAMRAGKSGAVDVEVVKLIQPEIGVGTVTPGEYFNHTTEWPGQIVTGEVLLEKGQVVYLDVIRSENTTDFTLLTPDGRNEVFSSYGDRGPEPIKQAGVHRLLADPRGDKLAEFEIKLHVLSPAVIDGGNYEPGSFLTGSTTQPGQMVDYTVELAAGQVVYLDVIDTSATTDFSLISPDGRTEIVKSYGDRGPLEVPTGGVHTLRADPRADDLSEYEAKLHVLSPPVLEGGSIEAGELIRGSTSQPGQIVHYDVTLEDGGPWSFQRISSSATTDFKLNDVRSGKKFMDSYGNVKSFTVSEGGTYRLVVDPRGDDLSEFEFRFERPVP